MMLVTGNRHSCVRPDNEIVLPDVFGMSRRRGYFPLSLRLRGDRDVCKLVHVAGRKMCTVSAKVGNRVCD